MFSQLLGLLWLGPVIWYLLPCSWKPYLESRSQSLIEGETTLSNARCILFSLWAKAFINSLSANMTKWSNTLKQFVSNLPTNCLSVFDHFVVLTIDLEMILYNAPPFAKLKILSRDMRSSKHFGSLLHWIMKPSRAYWPNLLTLNKNSAVSSLDNLPVPILKRRSLFTFWRKAFMFSWMLLSIFSKSLVFFIIHLGYRSWETSSFIVISNLQNDYQPIADIEFVKYETPAFWLAPSTLTVCSINGP